MIWRRPLAAEMAGYFERYTAYVHESNPIEVLKSANETSLDLMTSLDLDQWDYRYADGKWSIKEVWMHILDTERIFAYRALRFGRNDQTPLPGFDQDDYILPSKAHERSIASILEEYDAVRKATIALFEYLPPEAYDRIGEAANNKISVRALAYIIAGHERHHLKGLSDNYHIKQVL